MEHPLISVVTVSFNAVRDIEKTILSVINQTYQNIEYIIIDGGSTDGTVDIIKKYAGHITYWVSEPDKGIYDAFNKGWKIAKGEWIYYLGADDVLLPNAFTSIFLSDLNEYGIVFGDVIYKTPLGLIHKNSNRNIDSIKKRLNCSHQGFIMRKNIIAKMGGFDFYQYKISADYDLILRSYLTGFTMKYVPVEIAIFDTSGTSGTHKMEKECFIIRRNNKSIGLFQNYILWVHNVILFFLRSIKYKVFISKE